jgi:anti-sigma B factor antagonist
VLKIHSEVNPDGCTVCRPSGEMDAFTVSEFRRTLAELMPTRRLIIDLSEVAFVDSAGLGALIGGIRRARDVGGSVVLVCSRQTLAALLHTTGVDRIVTVVRTVEEAAARLEGSELADADMVADS